MWLWLYICDKNVRFWSFSANNSNDYFQKKLETILHPFEPNFQPSCAFEELFLHVQNKTITTENPVKN